MKVLTAIHPDDMADYAALPEAARHEITGLLRAMSAICTAARGQIQQTIAREAMVFGLSQKRMRSLWDTFRKSGHDWRTLINRSKFPEIGERRKVSVSDIQTFRKFAERNQRKTRPAHRSLVRAWRRGEIHTDTPINPVTGLPEGWTYRNMLRHQSSKFELTAMRQGFGAAISQHMGRVHTTRCGLWVGSHYVPDDVLRDFKVLLLQGARGKEARVAELGVLDVYSGHRFAVHRRPEFITDEGKKDKIKEREMRFLTAAILRNQGYSPRGTEWLTELGTAAVRKALASFLHDHSKGLITVREAGITGKTQALKSLTGRGGGNPAHKSWVESHHNLLQNEAGHLLAATGHDRNPPEWLHGIERETEQIIKWIAELPAERAMLLRANILEYWQALDILREIDQVIATRTDHDLQGWAECRHTTIEYRTDLTTDQWITQEEFLSLPAPAQNNILSLVEVMPPGVIARPRKLSPLEVYQRGCSELIRFPDHVIALMFCSRDLGDDLRASRRLNSSSEIEIQDSIVSAEPMLFQGHATSPDEERIALDSRATYGTVLNPFDTSTLWIYDPAGRYIGTSSRIQRACLADKDAVIPQLAERSHTLATLTAPLRERHSDIEQNIREIHAHNAAVLSESTPEDARAERSAARAGRAILSQPKPSPEPEPEGTIEDWGESAAPPPAENIETW